jgi:hypothetical protein
MFNNTKGLVGVIVTLILLLGCVAGFIYLQQWFLQYRSDIDASVRVEDFTNTFEISKIEGTYVYFNNDFRDDVIIESVKIGDKVCYAGNLEIDKGRGRFDIGGCTMGLDSLEAYDIRIITSDGVKSEFEMIRQPIENSLIVVE